MKNKLSLIISLICILKFFSSTFPVFGQDKYWVFYKDKKGVTFDPYAYFDAKAIERRINNKITLYDSTDFPLNDKYVKATMLYADSLSQVSRWFNASAVYIKASEIDNITKLPFVSSVEPIATYSELAQYENDDKAPAKIDEKLLQEQIQRMKGDYFIKNNINGKGIRIAVFDAGFPNVDKHPAFEHIRAAKRILKTWDFVKNREFVYAFSSHGAMTLSCIAGKYNDKPIGLATEAEFLLARTEMSNREPFSEEENWLAAAEWADKNGANIISSSLGYTNKRYFQKDMNGKTALVSRAANMAASKGMLVVNAAGNEGTSAWKFMGAPADADSVLSVGGYDPETNYKINFSSFGPTADKRLKPNVCAFGTAFVADKESFTTASGTSFSCPLIAGFAACAWQTNRNLKNMALYKEIEKSADLYPYFDYAHGYGVPQADYFTEKNQNKTLKETFAFEPKEKTLDVVVKNDTGEATGIYDAKDQKEKLLFYNIQNEDGTLQKYYVISVHSDKPVTIDLNTIKKGQKINVSYKGYQNTYQN